MTNPIRKNLDVSTDFGVDSMHGSAGDVFMRSVSKPIAWLCLLLTFVSAYGFAAHQHSSSGDEAKCTVCVVAQSASPAGRSTLPSAVLVVVRLIVVGQPVAAKQHPIAFALSVRPPPSV